MIRESFNSNWFYRKEAGAKDTPLTGPITLPHDTMLLEKRDPLTRNGHHTGYFPGGVYRYSRKFFAPVEYQNKHIVFEFEGVYQSSEVFINGQLAGGHPYGYTNFSVSADDFLQYGQENQIEVIVHNEHEPNSRWYSGSGIYRNVKILVSRNTTQLRMYILPDGVKITTRELDDQRAVVEVAVTIANESNEDRSVRVVTEFHSKHGETPASPKADASPEADSSREADDSPEAAPVESTTVVKAGETTTIRQVINVQNPAVWSLEAPNLYACSTKIIAGEAVVDEARETFGIRTLALDSKRGFRLNGKEIKLRGGCLHHDNGIIGACTLEAAEDRRVRLLKASGFNAIRSAHNPLSKAMLDACDRHGMLVMDEFSDVWLQKKTKYDYALYFRDWWERDIQAMVEKDYNHPCVILYSIGNEIRETALPEGVEYSQKLADKVKSLDPTRYVINCINGWYSMLAGFGIGTSKKKIANAHQIEAGAAQKGEAEQGTGGYINPLMNFINSFMDLILALPGIDQGTRDAYATVDVAGYNYMAGRYAMDGRRYPERVICGSETFPPEIANNWRLVKKFPHVIGDFSWTGWDYLGEAGLCTWQYGRNQALFKPYPCILADSPIIDITGYRQTQSYIHEIVWGLRKEPYIAVRPVNHAGETPSKSVWRGTNAIASWTWHGYEGKRAVVEVYADAGSVELFQNGKSLGRKPAGDPHSFKTVFRTTYQPGELTAVSYTPDGKEAGRMTLRTASRQLHLHVQAESSALQADGADLAYINIVLADENGILNPLADRRVTVGVEGEGTLLGLGSANPLTEESFTDQEHTTYQGRALAVVRAGIEVGTVKVSVSAEGCETKILTIPVEAPVEISR